MPRRRPFVSRYHRQFRAVRFRNKKDGRTWWAVVDEKNGVVDFYWQTHTEATARRKAKKLTDKANKLPKDVRFPPTVHPVALATRRPPPDLEIVREDRNQLAVTSGGEKIAVIKVTRRREVTNMHYYYEFFAPDGSPLYFPPILALPLCGCHCQAPGEPYGSRQDYERGRLRALAEDAFAAGIL